MLNVSVRNEVDLGAKNKGVFANFKKAENTKY